MNVRLLRSPKIKRFPHKKWQPSVEVIPVIHDCHGFPLPGHAPGVQISDHTHVTAICGLELLCKGGKNHLRSRRAILWRWDCVLLLCLHQGAASASSLRPQNMNTVTIAYHSRSQWRNPMLPVARLSSFTRSARLGDRRLRRQRPDLPPFLLGQSWSKQGLQ